MRDVIAERFFHINRILPYAPRPLLKLGENIEVGLEENPFFHFFRMTVRQQSVSQADGTSRMVPAIRFIRDVKDGLITPSNFPAIAFETANHFVMLARELLWEQIRVAEFTDRPSRQRAIWLFADIAAAPDWERRLQCNAPGQSQRIEVEVTGRLHECDASLLLGDSESLDDSERKARAYWRGEMRESGSQPEVLFEGSLKVIRFL